MAVKLLCAVDGCCKPTKARGWCNTHYERWRHNGAPTANAPRPSEIDRFLDKVSPEPNSGCWIWTATVNQDGCGHFGIGPAKCEKAHRASYRIFKGEIPTGLIVCHKCDAPSCVNPDHLFLGTSQDNMDDAKSKGRMALGERSGVARLTEDAVRFIRTSPLSQRQLAKVLGVHRGTVDAVLSGRTWAHVD